MLSRLIVFVESLLSKTSSSSESFLIQGCEWFLLTTSASSNPSASHIPPSLFLYQLNRLKVASQDTASVSMWASLMRISQHHLISFNATYFCEIPSTHSVRAIGGKRISDWRMGFEPLWFNNSSPFFNIQLVLCKIGLWSCCKCFLTSRLRLDVAVSPNDGEDVKRIMMSDLIRYAMLYSLTRGIASCRSMIGRYLAWRNDWTVSVQEAAGRLIGGRPLKADFRTRLVWPFQIVASHNGETFGHFLVINGARIRGSLCNDLIAFVIPIRWAPTRLQGTVGSKKTLHKSEFIPSKLQLKVIQLLRQSNRLS